MTFAVLADECLPRAIVLRLRDLGFDVRYAAETDGQASDIDLLVVAQDENRVVITEDFDFGELLIRRGMKAPGAIIVFMPDLAPAERAERVAAVVADPVFNPAGQLVIVSRDRIRQRRLET